MEKITSRIIVIDDNTGILQEFSEILINQTHSMIENHRHQLCDKRLAGDLALSFQDDAKLLHCEVDLFSEPEKGIKVIQKSYRIDIPYMIVFLSICFDQIYQGIERIQRILATDESIQIIICAPASANFSNDFEPVVNALGITDNWLLLKQPIDKMLLRQFLSLLTRKWHKKQESKSQQKFLEEGLAKRTKELELIKSTLQSSEAGIVIVDQSGELIDYNEKFKAMWRIPSEILASGKLEMVFQYLDTTIVEPKDFLEQVEILQKESLESSFSTIKLKNGQVYERHFQPQSFNNTRVGTVWRFIDITDRVAIENKLQFQATHDALTQLPNRTLLYDRVQQAIASAERYQHRIALYFIHLEGMEGINKQFGHTRGDQLIKAIAERLADNIRDEDTLARFDGCVLVFLARKLSHQSDINVVANKLLNKLKQPFQIDGQMVQVVVSIGISAYPSDGKNFSELLRGADLAAQAAQKDQGSSYHFFDRQQH